jgi:hypothetical protein
MTPLSKGMRSLEKVEEVAKAVSGPLQVVALTRQVVSHLAEVPTLPLRIAPSVPASDFHSRDSYDQLIPESMAPAHVRVRLAVFMH